MVGFNIMKTFTCTHLLLITILCVLAHLNIRLSNNNLKMEDHDMKLGHFKPQHPDACAAEWEDYKREFQILLDAKGLHNAPGRRKVGQLLKYMGRDHILTFDTFTWAPAVVADAPNNIEARDAESQEDLETVFAKFDAHFGVHRFRSIKRQQFLDTKRGNLTIMNFISELKRKARYCQYGDREESMICDMVINRINDAKCSERLMELSDDQLTLSNVMKICRQVELTKAHVTSITKSGGEQQVNRVYQGRGRHRGRRSRGQGRGDFSRRPYRSQYRGGYQGDRNFCDRCCKYHPQNDCPAYHQFCGSCGERGHFKKSPRCKVNGQSNSNSGQYSQRRPGNRQFHRGRYSSRGRFRPSGRRQNVHFSDNDYYNDGYDNEYYDDGYAYGDDSYNVYSYQYDNVHDANDSHDLSEMFDQCTTQDVFTIDVQNVHNADIDPDDWSVTMDVCGKPLHLQIDSGASCNVVSLSTLLNLNLCAKITPSDVIISGVSGNKVRAYGCIRLPCRYKSVRLDVDFQVIDNTHKNVNLLGRTDSVKFGLIARVNTVTKQKCSTADDDLLSEYSDVLGDEIGCMPNTYTIKIDHSVPPVVHAPRPVPVPIREQVKAELTRLESCGIITKVVDPTDWVSSMVCVRKKTGRVRICIDPTDLNRAILREHYPMNSIEDVCTRLHGSQYFSTLDANSGYFQLKLDEDSSYLTTFNTPFGRYRYLRMPMGLKCSPEIFQREMVQSFGDIKGVEIVMDDILIHGISVQEHDARLKQVLQRARKLNLKLNKQKSHIRKTEVQYVGHKLTKDGLQPTDDRIRSISNLKEPTDVSELETILGMLAYVAKFIPNLSQLTEPLREVKKQETWTWGPRQTAALDSIKKILITQPLLKYYDVRKPVTLSVDASSKGLGAAVMQADGVVAYASRSLTETEQRYPQIDKEMLAVVFGCTKFHKLIYGKSDVVIESDHQPLETILKKPIHKAPMRVQRMRLKLQPYEFNLIHVSGKALGLADCLSRMTRNEKPEKDASTMDDELMVCQIDMMAYGWHDRLAEATSQDEELQVVIDLIMDGWPVVKSLCPALALRYWDYRDELGTYHGLVVRGDRICIPASMRAEMVEAIHKPHLGMVKSKQRARDLVFWPSMNKQIEEAVSKCSVCQKYQHKPQKEPMIIHPLPSLPWEKVGTDIGELNGKSFLVIVDYYSNFIEAMPLPDTQARTVIQLLKASIARFGIMKTLISDNGPQYSSGEFKDFINNYGITHVTSSPLYPQSNGLAEKAVQTVKRIMKKCKETGEDVYLALLDLNNTPRDGIVGSPVQRLMGRRTRTRLPTSDVLLKPGSIRPEQVQNQLLKYRQNQKRYYDRGTKPLPDVGPNDPIRVRTPRGYEPAEYVRKGGTPRSHIVKAGERAHEYRRNRSQLLKTRELPHQVRPRREVHVPLRLPPAVPARAQPPIVEPVHVPLPNNLPVGIDTGPPVSHNHSPVKTRSGRVSRLPGHFKDYIT